MSDRRITIRWTHIAALALAAGAIVTLSALCLFLLASNNAITQLCIDKLGQK